MCICRAKIWVCVSGRATLPGPLGGLRGRPRRRAAAHGPQGRAWVARCALAFVPRERVKQGADRGADDAADRDARAVRHAAAQARAAAEGASCAAVGERVVPFAARPCCVAQQVQRVHNGRAESLLRPWLSLGQLRSRSLHVEHMASVSRLTQPARSRRRATVTGSVRSVEMLLHCDEGLYLVAMVIPRWRHIRMDVSISQVINGPPPCRAGSTSAWCQNLMCKGHTVSTGQGLLHIIAKGSAGSPCGACDS
jgi:hypothetical protein